MFSDLLIDIPIQWRDYCFMKSEYQIQPLWREMECSWYTTMMCYKPGMYTSTYYHSIFVLLFCFQLSNIVPFYPGTVWLHISGM